MPWAKTFDNDDVLDKAMMAFWARGYGATSMQDLVACMGINRGSLYATFGDKRSLFLRALRRYDAEHRGDWVAGLAARHAPREAILTAFDQAITAVLEGGDRNGCLLVNTALELSPHDPEVGAIVEGSIDEMEGFFRDMIRRGQASGEIPVSVPATQTAHALLGLFIGLRVLARSRPEPRLLRSIANQAAEMLT